MSAYYNDTDPYAAAWLRNLIAAGHIAPGDVDERSIVDVRADDLRGYRQCHWFGGIGGWSLALRLAGWDDDRPVWTGSCPCQPFSSAGRGKAADDERHLWPAWASLIAECRPPVVLGEQVEAAIGWGWLDLVFADLEAEGYACASAVLPACGVGAPHIRNRVWWVADADQQRRGRNAIAGDMGRPHEAQGRAGDKPASTLGGSGATDGLADARHAEWRTRDLPRDDEGRHLLRQGREEGSAIAGQRGEDGGLADADRERVRGECRDDGDETGEIPGEVRQQWLRPDDRADGATDGLADAMRGGAGHGPGEGLGAKAAPDGGDGRLPGQRLRTGVEGAAHLMGHADNARPQGRLVRRDGAGQRPAGAAGMDGVLEHAAHIGHTGGTDDQRGWSTGQRQRDVRDQPVGSSWSDLVWLPCRDGKARPTQPGLQPLAHGSTARVGRLRAYGNAIVAPLAAEFVSAFMECEP